MVSAIIYEDERHLFSVLPDFAKKKNCDLEEKFGLLNFDAYLAALELCLKNVKKVCLSRIGVTWS